ncbi:MAG: hypothetical protein FWE24_11625 [Defluviitaleaceae bacterium]|nr:hypothetical protein [Defluviitaleaceae bacterium]
MRGKKRSIAVRRKKEEIMQEKELGGVCEKLLIIAFAALAGSFLKGIVIGYLIGKHR